ncbi:MAG: heme-binding protein [Betaproteobacteria bacterium]|nr:heme-binding protein [Betaproteobacteria bacterium]
MIRTRIAIALTALFLTNAASAAEKLTTQTASLTTAAALQVAQAALAECQKGGNVVAVAVVDRSGVPLALLRDNLAGPHTPKTAIRKAWTAVSFRNNTSNLLDLSAPGKPSAGIRDIPGVVVLGGGLTISAGGTLLGAVGVSGAPGGHLDDACGNAGIKAIQGSLELE